MRVKPHKCYECEQTMEIRILRDRKLFYVGTACACGPYSRETDNARLVTTIARFDGVEL